MKEINRTMKEINRLMRYDSKKIKQDRIQKTIKNLTMYLQALLIALIITALIWLFISITLLIL